MSYLEESLAPGETIVARFELHWTAKGRLILGIILIPLVIGIFITIYEWLRLRAIELGVKGYSFGDCIDDYRWTLMFCLCYPVIGGGLGDPANDRGVALAKAMTDRCVSAIRDWKAFEVLKP